MLNFAVSLADQVSGPAKQAGGALSGLEEGLVALADPATAAVAILGALAAAALATGAALYEGATIALEASDAYGDMVTQFDALTGQGEEAVAMLDNVSAATPKTRKELEAWANTLAAAGETDLGQLDRSLTAIASSEALMGSHGKEAASQVQSLMQRVLEAETAGTRLKLADKQLVALAKTGVNVDDVAKKMGVSAQQLRNQLKAGTTDAAKFGDALQDALIEKGAGALEANMNDIPTLTAKAKESFTKLFEGVDTEGFTKGLGELVGMLDQSTTSGQALKWIVTQLFNGVFKLATAALPIAHLLLLKLGNDALRVYIYFKPLIKQLGEFSMTSEDLETVVTVLEYSLIGLAAVAGILGIALLAVVAAGALLVGVTFTALALVLLPVIALVWLLSKAADALIETFGDDAQDAADALINGLIVGLTGGQSLVDDAMVALATGGLDAFKKKLGISSPAKAMIDAGESMGQGAAIGVDNTAGQVVDATTRMAEIAIPSATSGGGAPAASGAGVTVYVEAGAIVVGGSGSATELTEHAAALMFERIALSQGLGTA